MTILQELDKIKDILINKKVLIAVSGGVDSLSLLISFDEWNNLNKLNIDFAAITIDHKLRELSTDEANYVSNLCKKLSIKHTIKTWEGQKPEANLEFEAREVRYKLIKEEYNTGNFDYLLVAHHLDDQAETFFIRLFRGSGIDGLSAMNSNTILYEMNVLRPFLNLHKETLIDYLKFKNITWMEDESNSDDKYLRNKIRNFLNSFEDKNIITERIDFAIKEIVKSKKFIDIEFNKIADKILKFNSFGSAILNFSRFSKINQEIVLKILSFSATTISGNIYKPRLKKLQRLYDNILNLKIDDSFKYTFYGCVFEKINDSLIMIYREYNSIGEDVDLIYNEEIIWDNRFKIKLLKDEKNLKITHAKEEEFNKILEKTRKENFLKYKELKEVVGIQKNIFYTLPLLLRDEEYILSSSLINIVFIKQ